MGDVRDMRKEKRILLTVVCILLLCSLTGCKRDNSVLKIGKKVTKIEKAKYKDKTEIETLIIPDSVTEIDQSAFEGCTGLKEITIPDSVVKIGKHAFKGCTSLQSVTIPGHVNGAYERETAVFENCPNIHEIIITGETVNSHFSEMFAPSYFHEGIPESVKITLSDSITEIKNQAFAYCSFLTSLKLPSSVTSIGDMAFYDAGLTSFTIPDTVTSLGEGVFENCKNLSSVRLPSNLEVLPDRFFWSCKALTSIDFPDSLRSIGEYAFSDCGFTSITIPDTIHEIGDHAFSRCWELVSIDLPETIQRIGEATFSGCSKLAAFKIPESVTEIDERAFEGCSSLTSIEFPESVSRIGRYAFAGCDLTSLTIPESVEKVESEAFCGNVNLKSALLYGDCLGGGIFTDDSYKVGVKSYPHCTSLSEITFTGTKVPSAASGCEALSSVTIADTVTSIGVGAFSGCTALKSIELPDGVTEIGAVAFSNCTSLEFINIPDGITQIGDRAFERTVYLQDIKDMLSSLTKNGGDSIAYDGTTELIPQGKKVIPIVRQKYGPDLYGELYCCLPAEIRTFDLREADYVIYKSVAHAQNNHVLGFEDTIVYLNLYDKSGVEKPVRICTILHAPPIFGYSRHGETIKGSEAEFDEIWREIKDLF